MSSNNNLFDVNGKVVIVTGANRGNGLAISEGLAELGAKVIRVDKKFDKTIGSNDIVFDLKDISKIKILVDSIVDRYGSIDGLFGGSTVCSTVISDLDAAFCCMGGQCSHGIFQHAYGIIDNILGAPCPLAVVTPTFH